MGCCDSCLKTDADAPQRSEYTQLISTEISTVVETPQPTVTENSGRYYQSIIEDAQGKFLSATFRHRTGLTHSDAGSVKIRAQLAEANVDRNLLVSPPNRAGRIDPACSKLRVSEILGETVEVTAEEEMATDEIAEIVAATAFHIARIEDSQTALVSLKPVTGSSS